MEMLIGYPENNIDKIMNMPFERWHENLIKAALEDSSSLSIELKQKLIREFNQRNNNNN